MKDFEYAGCFIFSDGDEETVMENISNGMDVETAVKDWSYGLDDCEYYEEGMVHDQIVDYIKEKVGE